MHVMLSVAEEEAMHIYEYKCRDCDEVFEILTGMGSGEKVAACKHCGSDHVERILSARPRSWK